MKEGRYAEARSSLEEAKVASGRLTNTEGDSSICNRLLGEVEMSQGHYDEARRLLRTSRDKLEELGNKRDAILACQALSRLDALAVVQFRPDPNAIQ